jgi:two-component system response regulator YesN
VRGHLLAAHVHLHPNYLCALFKEHTGERIFDYLTRVRVDTAAAILRREDISVSRLAEQTGFPSESLFYQKFRQQMGMSPKAYRRAQERNGDREE